MGISSKFSQGDDAYYTNRVKQQQEYVNKLLGEKAEAKAGCEEADQNQKTAYWDYKYATGILNSATDTKTQLEQKLKTLRERMETRITQARKKAQSEGKSQDEIDKIIDNIRSSYSDDINLAQYNITKQTKTFTLNQTSYTDSLTAYRASRFNNISATSSFLDKLSSLQDAYYDLGKFKQQQAYIESQGNNELNYKA